MSNRDLRPKKPGEESSTRSIEPESKSYFGFIILISAVAFISVRVGYQWPRDVELESTKPVQFVYQVTPEAAKYLIQKAFDGCPTSPVD